MAKNSAFGKAFKSAKDGSTFKFKGKSYKKEYASDNSGPKKGAPIPTARPQTGGAYNKPVMGGAKATASSAFKAATSKSKPMTRTPAQRDIAKSKAYIANNPSAKGATSKMLKGMK